MPQKAAIAERSLPCARRSCTQNARSCVYIDMTKRGAMRLFHDPEIPGELLPAVLAHIAFARRRAAQFKLAALGTVILVCMTGFIPAVSYAIQEFRASGFDD